MRPFPAPLGSLAHWIAPWALLLGACGGAPRPAAGAPAASAVASPPAASSPSAGTDVASAPAIPAAPTATVAIPMIMPPPPPNPTSTKVTSKTDATWATCHHGYVAKNKDVVRDVTALAAGCAKATKMQLVGKTLTGKQGDQDPPQSFPLPVEANHCYRVYAQAAEGIRNLDLVLEDSTGAVAAGDSSDDGSPVAPEDGAACFKENDAATIVVSVGMGKGAYALQVWRD